MLCNSLDHPLELQDGPSCNGTLPLPGCTRTYGGLTFYSVDSTGRPRKPAWPAALTRHTSRSGRDGPMAELDESGECIVEPLAISCACAA